MTYFLPGVFIRVHFPFSSSAFGQFPVKSSQIGERGGPADEQTSASVQLGSGHRQNDVKGSLFCYPIVWFCIVLCFHQLSMSGTKQRQQSLCLAEDRSHRNFSGCFFLSFDGKFRSSNFNRSQKTLRCSVLKYLSSSPLKRKWKRWGENNWKLKNMRQAKVK